MGPSGTSGWRRGRSWVAALATVLAAGLLAAPAGAQTDPGGIPFVPGGSSHLSSTVIGVISSQSGAGDALDAIGDSLALAEARNRVEAKLKRAAARAAKAAPRAGEPASEGSPAPAEPISEEVKDPSEMVPASAGSNGTHVPHTSNLSREEIFAHTRAGEEGSTAILLSGVALAPPDAPAAVQGVINAANTIVGRPYVWGGGHAGFYSFGYDCSGSVSFALFGGGLIPEPLTSGSLEGWGAPGPGKWITIYANATHTVAEIAGLRWDTVGDAQGTGPRWHLAPNSHAGFVVRHPPGL
jgi:cell wall-associated NlpC family hydrolase